MEVILILFLGLNLIFWVGMASRHAYMTSRQFNILWGIISVTFAIMAFYFVPKSILDWDLVRLYRHINNIRSMGLDNALIYTEYRNLYVIKYWMYLVSLTKNNGWFPAIPLLGSFLIWGYIVKNSTIIRKQELHFDRVLFAGFIWISMMGLKLSFSDVRCTCAMGLCCLGFYFEYIRKEKRVLAILIYVTAIFIHHFTMMFLIFRAILFIKKLVKSKIILLVSSLLFQVVLMEGAKLISNNVTNEYIRTIARKLLADWGLYHFSTYFFGREGSMKILYLCFVAVFIIGYIWASLIRKKYITIIGDEEELNFERINDALFVLCCIGIGVAFNYLILERLLYIAAYIFSLHYSIIGYKNKRLLKVGLIIPILSYILFFNDINSFIVNALGFFYL